MLPGCIDDEWERFRWRSHLGFHGAPDGVRLTGPYDGPADDDIFCASREFWPSKRPSAVFGKRRMVQ